jgi:hypothetical protein
MIILNADKFKKVCKVMLKFCKSRGESERRYHNRIYIDKNVMTATNGKIMIIKDVSNCVSNNDRFSFPADVDVRKSIEFNDEKIIIDGEERPYSQYDFKYENAIPMGAYVEKVIDFSKYPTIRIPASNGGEVTFTNDEVIFTYNDDVETIASYGDIYETNLLTDENEITEFKIPMKQFYAILAISKKLVLREYLTKKPREFVADDYRIIVMPN